MYASVSRNRALLRVPYPWTHEGITDDHRRPWSIRLLFSSRMMSAASVKRVHNAEKSVMGTVIRHTIRIAMPTIEITHRIGFLGRVTRHSAEISDLETITQRQSRPGVPTQLH